MECYEDLESPYPIIACDEDNRLRLATRNFLNRFKISRMLKWPMHLASAAAKTNTTSSCPNKHLYCDTNDPMVLAMMFGDEPDYLNQDCGHQHHNSHNQQHKIEFLTNMDGTHSLPSAWPDDSICLDDEPDEDFLLYASDEFMESSSQQANQSIDIEGNERLQCTCPHSSTQSRLLIEIPDELRNEDDDDDDDDVLTEHGDNDENNDYFDDLNKSSSRPCVWPIIELHENPLNYLSDEQLQSMSQLSGEQFLNEFMNSSSAIDDDCQLSATEEANEGAMTPTPEDDVGMPLNIENDEIINGLIIADNNQTNQDNILNRTRAASTRATTTTTTACKLPQATSSSSRNDQRFADNNINEKINYSQMMLKRSRILSLNEANKDKRAAIKLVSSAS